MGKKNKSFKKSEMAKRRQINKNLDLTKKYLISSVTLEFDFEEETPLCIISNHLEDFQKYGYRIYEVLDTGNLSLIQDYDDYYPSRE